MKSVGGPHAARGARGLDSTALEALAKSTEGKLSSLNGGQHATEERLKDLSLGQQDLMKAQSELAYTQIGQVAGLADLAGRITSIESSIHGSRNPSPCPDYRVSSPMVDTQNVSAPSTSSALVETSQPQLRRSLRLQSKFRPDYRFPSKTGYGRIGLFRKLMKTKKGGIMFLSLKKPPPRQSPEKRLLVVHWAL